MLDAKASHRKVCERCLTITAHTHDQCPVCGYTQLSKIMITVQAGQNKELAKAGVG